MSIMTSAKERAAADLLIARESPLWPKAVAFLREDLKDVADDVRKAIAKDPQDHWWIAPYHFGWGMAVRNRLRKHNFGEEPFGVANLDNIYVELIEEAMRS